MRIGIDCRLWNETGVGRYIRNLTTNLLEIDTKNQYVLFILTKDTHRIQAHVGSRKAELRPADVRWHSIGEQIKFNTILKKESLDLMHFPYFSVPIRYDRPFVITIHDLILHHFPTGEASHLLYPLYRTKLAAYKYIIQQAAKKAKKIITVSEATKKEIVDHLHVSEKKVVVTYEGVEQTPNPKTQNPSEFDNYFLHVGNVYPHKNVERLLKAFRLYRERDSKNKNVKLVFVGREDFFSKKLKEKVNSMGVSDAVVFPGEVSDTKLHELYEHAIATVVPSLMEGFGLPAVEAMANKCLIIASDISSLHEVCGEAAIYTDPFRTSDIAEKLKIVSDMSKDERSQLIDKGLDIVKKYSWRKMAEETLTVYQSIK